jgi:hypothetical protein
MLAKFNMVRDINGYNGFGLQFTDINWSGILAAGVAQTITIPGSPYADHQGLILIFAFQPGSNIWVARNVAAVAPSGSVASTTSVANPTARQVYAGDVISFITNDASDEFGASLYAF